MCQSEVGLYCGLELTQQGLFLLLFYGLFYQVSYLSSSVLDLYCLQQGCSFLDKHVDQDDLFDDSSDSLLLHVEFFFIFDLVAAIVLDGMLEVGIVEKIFDITFLEGEVNHFGDNHDVVEVDIGQDGIFDKLEEVPDVRLLEEDALDGEHLPDW